jgi:8-oxo-dGTP diphosphatase
MVAKPFKLSGKVVIRDKEGRCLLIKRSMTSKGNPGKWDLPGGKIDSGEAFEDGLLREVAEETGLTVSLERVLGATESESPTARIVYLILKGRLQSGQVRLSEEHDDFFWAYGKDIETADLLDQFREFALAPGTADHE